MERSILDLGGKYTDKIRSTALVSFMVIICSHFDHFGIAKQFCLYYTEN